MPPVGKMSRDLTAVGGLNWMTIISAPSPVFAQAYLTRAEPSAKGTGSHTGLWKVIKQPAGTSPETINLFLRPHWFDVHVTQVVYQVQGSGISQAMFDHETWG